MTPPAIYSTCFYFAIYTTLSPELLAGGHNIEESRTPNDWRIAHQSPNRRRSAWLLTGPVDFDILFGPFLPRMFGETESAAAIAISITISITISVTVSITISITIAERFLAARMLDQIACHRTLVPIQLRRALMLPQSATNAEEVLFAIGRVRMMHLSGEAQRHRSVRSAVTRILAGRLQRNRCVIVLVVLARHSIGRIAGAHRAVEHMIGRTGALDAPSEIALPVLVAFGLMRQLHEAILAAERAIDEARLRAALLEDVKVQALIALADALRAVRARNELVAALRRGRKVDLVLRHAGAGEMLVRVRLAGECDQQRGQQASGKRI